MQCVTTPEQVLKVAETLAAQDVVPTDQAIAKVLKISAGPVAAAVGILYRRGDWRWPGGVNGLSLSAVVRRLSDGSLKGPMVRQGKEAAVTRAKARQDLPDDETFLVRATRFAAEDRVPTIVAMAGEFHLDRTVVRFIILRLKDEGRWPWPGGSCKWAGTGSKTLSEVVKGPEPPRTPLRVSVRSRRHKQARASLQAWREKACWLIHGIPPSQLAR